MLKTIAILLAVTAATIAGDYFIKIASDKPKGLLTITFGIGLVLYALPAIGWYFLMKSHSLAVIGVIYSAATVIMLAILSTLVFHEAFGWREGLGITLALMAVAIVGLR